jgi:hypothetical protein
MTATSILDRFLQDAELIQIIGKSCRLRGRAADTGKCLNSAEPATKESKTGQTRTPGRPKRSTNNTST